LCVKFKSENQEANLILLNAIKHVKINSTYLKSILPS